MAAIARGWQLAGVEPSGSAWQMTFREVVSTANTLHSGELLDPNLHIPLCRSNCIWVRLLELQGTVEPSGVRLSRSGDRKSHLQGG